MLLFIIPIVLSLFIYMHLPAPKSMTLKLLNGSTVKIERDKYSIPHIYPDTLEDFCYGIGYTMGQDRLWLIDITRRLATGRLSEFFGNITLETDKFIRNVKIPILAQRDLSYLSPIVNKSVQAYVDGISRAAKESTPIEYYILWTRWTDFTMIDYQSTLYLM